MCIFESGNIFFLFPSSVQSLSRVSLWPRGLQYARLLCPSTTLRAYSNSYPSCRWCHPTISSSVVPFSSHLQSFPALGYLQISQFFALGGQRIGVSASTSVLAMNIQDWFPLRLTWLDLLAVQGKLINKKHHFMGNNFSGKMECKFPSQTDSGPALRRFSPQHR